MSTRKSYQPDASSIPVCGVASLQMLNDFLDGSSTFRQFTNRCRASRTNTPRNAEHACLVGFVTKEDIEEEKRRAGTRLELLVTRTVYFVVFPTSTNQLPCLVWHRRLSSKMSFVLRLVQAERLEPALAFTLSEPWVEVLCRLQERPVRGLIEALSFTTKEQAVGIKDEIRKRRALFGEFRNAFYLQDVESILAWEIAENWAQWEATGTSLGKRRDQICKRWGLNMTEPEFKRLTPPLMLEKLKIPPLIATEPPFADKVREQVVKLFAERTVRKQATCERTVTGEIFYCEPPPLPFSRGGSFGEYFCHGQGKLFRGFPSKEAFSKQDELKESLWWWRDIGKWPIELQREFPDNFEASAFIYELRARLVPHHTWDVFDAPWFQLDTSQRAVLFYLWPPDPGGVHFRLGRIANDNPAEFEFLHTPVSIDPSAPSHQLASAIPKPAQYWRHVLMGMPVQSKRRKPLKKKDWKWGLLEALDLKFFFSSSLTNAEVKAQQRARKAYEEACAEAGLPPYRSPRKSTA